MTSRTKMVTGVGLGAALAVAGIGALLVNRSAEAGDATASAAAVASADVRGNGETVVVYRSPTCGCCKAWEDHMRAAGYTIESHEVMDVTPVKNEQGVPAPLRSCHTATVGGYTFEGHVPAEDVVRVLAERPEIDGLAVPGMPPGSPGMDVPGREDEPFEVFSFRAGGESEIWATRR
ncbi:MAG TPA: DUF411 domain-containing protein [Longimicrobiales bacterium]